MHCSPDTTTEAVTRLQRQQKTQLVTNLSVDYSPTGVDQMKPGILGTSAEEETNTKPSKDDGTEAQKASVTKHEAIG